MYPTIEQANEARRLILARCGPLLADCIIHLTDNGFVIRVAVKAGVSLDDLMRAMPITISSEIMGVPVKFWSGRDSL